jgi:hypothetical protein
LNAEGKELWQCGYCEYNYLASGGTGNAAKHLMGGPDLKPKAGYGMRLESPRGAEAKRKQMSIDQAAEHAE